MESSSVTTTSIHYGILAAHEALCQGLKSFQSLDGSQIGDVRFGLHPAFAASYPREGVPPDEALTQPNPTRPACPLGPAAPLPLPLGPFPAPCPCPGSRLPSRDHGRRPSLRVTTGPVGARFSGLKAYRTDDRPRTPRCYTREGDAAVPVCMGRARCRWVWGVDWLGCEARRVTQQCRAWPGPGPVSHAGGGPWAGLNPLLWALGGGGL